MRDEPAKKVSWVKWAMVAGVVIALIAAQQFAGSKISAESLRDWITSFGNIAPVVFVLFYAVAPLVFFPGSVLSAAAGLIWGWKAAFIYVTLGANLSANLAFFVGRWLGQERVQKLTAGRFKKFEEKISGAGFQTIFFLRLVPLVPFNVLNYGAGVTRVRWRDYMLGSLLGMVPGTLAYVYLGGHLDWRMPQLWFALSGLLVLGGMPTLWKWWKARTEKNDTEVSWLGWIPLGAGVVAALIGVFMLVNGGTRASENVRGGHSATAEVVLPSGIDHRNLDKLLSEFVSADNLVRYADLKSSATAMASLREYNDSLAFKDDSTTGSYSDEEKLAIYLNAYNALTISTILEHYPVESIMKISGAFDQQRHDVGNARLSLDQVEQLALALGGYRVHAAVVCAARSCPPLRLKPYVASQLDEQLDDQMRQWLANPDLNRFETNTVKVSSIFEWYAKDYEGAEGGLRGVLKKYAPREGPQPLADADQKIEFLDYDWGLNDENGQGKSYGKTDRLLDEVKKRL